MDAIKFVETLQRKIKNENRDEIIIRVTEDASLLVDLTEEWSKEHPAKTRQSVFLEQYSNAKRDCKDILCVCPADVYGDSVCPKNKEDAHIMCYDCRREFWMQEVE